VERSRKKKIDPGDSTDATDQIPGCPQCGKPMVLRTARTGKSIGKQFWGCSDYPDCKAVLKL
jgi:restriction system protein